jgi:hypothetical protein
VVALRAIHQQMGASSSASDDSRSRRCAKPTLAETLTVPPQTGIRVSCSSPAWGIATIGLWTSLISLVGASANWLVDILFRQPGPT